MFRMCWLRSALVAASALGAALGAARADKPAIELFTEPRLGGQGLGLNEGTDDLGNFGYRNSVMSILVNQGRWELCEKPQYEGRCHVFGPGPHEVMPDALRYSQGSLRPAEFGGNWGGSGGNGAARGALTLYEHERGGGRSVGIDGPVGNLKDRQFNDTASSLEVRSGRWEVCVHADFGAPCRTFGPGRYDLGGEFQDAISSARPAGGTFVLPPNTRTAVLLYENSDFSGREVAIRTATPNLKALAFNDQAASVVVLSGAWQFCADADYSGTCMTYGPGRHRLVGALKNGLSSLRPR